MGTGLVIDATPPVLIASQRGTCGLRGTMPTVRVKASNLRCFAMACAALSVVIVEACGGRGAETYVDTSKSRVDSQATSGAVLSGNHASAGVAVLEPVKADTSASAATDVPSDTATTDTLENAPAQQPPPEVEPPPVVLTVLNLDGQPVFGAEVIHDRDGLTLAQRTLTTGADGQVSVPADASVSVSAAGYVRATPRLLAGQQARTVYLLPASTIELRVLHAGTRKPVAGVSVSRGPLEVGVTDASGTLRIDGLAPGRMLLTATGPGVLGTRFAAVGLGESQVLDVAVHRTTAVAGRVTVDGKTCPGGYVSVAIGVEGGSSICPICGGADDTLSTAISSNGSFRIEVPPGLLYAPEVACDDAIVEHPSPLFVVGPPLTGLHFDASRGRAIRGRVVDKNGRGVPNIDVLLGTEELHEDNSTRSVETDANGRFAVAGLIADTYSLKADSAAPVDVYYEGEASVDLEQGDATDVVIEVVGSPWEPYPDDSRQTPEPVTTDVHGTVVDLRGRPIFGAVVVAQGVRRRHQAQNALSTTWVGQPPVRSDVDGRFTLQVVPPDPDDEEPVLVLAFVPGGDVGVWDLEHLDKPVTIRTAPLGSIVGTVRDRFNRPVPHFAIDLERGRARKKFVFAPDGRFEVPGLVEGTSYPLGIHAPLGVTGKSVAIRRGKSTRVGNLKVAGVASTLALTLENLAGQDVAGCDVQTQLIGGRPRPKQTTDDEGWVYFEDVPAGPTWIRVGPCTVAGQYYPAQRQYVAVRAEPNAMQWLRVAAQGTRSPVSLGYEVAPLKPSLDPLAQSLRVTRVRPDSPAAQAGLQVGDVIVGVGKHSVSGRRSYLHEPLTKVAAGMSVKLRLADGRGLELQTDAKTGR